MLARRGGRTRLARSLELGRWQLGAGYRRAAHARRDALPTACPLRYKAQSRAEPDAGPLAASPRGRCSADWAQLSAVSCPLPSGVSRQHRGAQPPRQREARPVAKREPCITGQRS